MRDRRILLLSQPVLFGDKSYAQFVKTIQPANFLGGFPLNETRGYRAFDIKDPAGTASLGIYRNVALVSSTGPDGDNVGLWLGSTTPACNVYGTIKTGLTASIGSVLCWYKVRAASVWTDGASRPLFKLIGAGQNDITLRRGNANNAIAFVYYANTVADTASQGGLSSTGWLPVVATWSAADDRIRLYVNTSTAVETTGLGVWNGGAFSTFAIGASSAGGAVACDGYLAHMYFWDTELTPADVAKLIVAPSKKSNNLTRAALAANPAAPLVTVTSDGSGEATHPSVYDAGQGSTHNGYRFWMVMTPLPAASNTYEAPEVLASADGDTWEVPTGVTNPLDPPPADADFDADVCLIVDGDTDYVTYFASDGTDGIRYRSSTDGWQTVGDEGVVLNVAQNTVTSPEIIKDGATWKMWCVNTAGAAPYKITLRTADAITGAWSAAQDCTITLPTGRNLHHIDVHKEGSAYVLYFTVINTLTSPTNYRECYKATSTDGITWTGVTLVLDPQSNNWDGLDIYKPCVLPADGGGHTMWYGGVSVANAWRIGRVALP